MANRAWLDVETTSLDTKRGAIIEMALVVEINNEQLKTFYRKIKPHDDAIIEDGALKVNKFTREELSTFEDGQKVCDELVKEMASYDCIFVLAGHNVNFDRDYLYTFFCRYGHYGSYHRLFRSRLHCTLKRARERKHMLRGTKLNLGALCEHFGIDLENAHCAEDDILATIQVDKYLDAFRIETEIELDGSTLNYHQKRDKYLGLKYIMFGKDGDVFLSKDATTDKKAFRFILNEIWELYGE